MWDVLRRGTSQVLFSDLTEVAAPSLLWLYGQSGEDIYICFGGDNFSPH